MGHPMCPMREDEHYRPGAQELQPRVRAGYFRAGQDTEDIARRFHERCSLKLKT